MDYLTVKGLILLELHNKVLLIKNNLNNKKVKIMIILSMLYSRKLAQ